MVGGGRARPCARMAPFRHDVCGVPLARGGRRFPHRRLASAREQRRCGNRRPPKTVARESRERTRMDEASGTNPSGIRAHSRNSRGRLGCSGNQPHPNIPFVYFVCLVVTLLLPKIRVHSRNSRACSYFVIARSPACGTTKQSSHFDRLKAPSQSRGWIATARFAHLAMTSLIRTLHSRGRFGCSEFPPVNADPIRLSIPSPHPFRVFRVFSGDPPPSKNSRSFA